MSAPPIQCGSSTPLLISWILRRRDSSALRIRNYRNHDVLVV